MENRGLIFIPDISGFTRFINDTEIGHSRQIIQELLEVIINANQIGLEISEIEGDAVLFYKYGDAPDLKDLYQQVEKMFCAFHKYLASYELRRLCQCSACKGAVDLTLKVVSHYGEFTGYNVKNFSKLIGKDIIVAHQLLKNDIDQHEYWLLTKDLAEKRNTTILPEWMNWSQSTKQTETGDIPFEYSQLTPLKNSLPPDADPGLEISNKVRVITMEKEIDAEILTLLFTAVNFENRKNWQVGIKDIDQVSHGGLPRVGTSHRCITPKETMIVYSSSFEYSPEKIVYSETDAKKIFASYFTLEKINDNKTKLTFDLYLKKNPVFLTMFKLFKKKKMEKQFAQSLENLSRIASQAKIPA